MQTNEAEFAAYVGIDWGDKTHAVAILPAGSTKEEEGEFAQTPEAIDEWATRLGARFGGRPVAVILEQTHRDRLRPWRPDDAQTRLIGILAEDRRRLVEQRTRLSNQLQTRLKQVFPLALEVLGSLTTDLATQLAALAEPLRDYDRQLAEQMRQHPDAAIFRSFPGAGAALAPRLLAAFGSDRDRLQQASEMQDLSGISPVTRRSGRLTSVRRRWACNKFLRQTFQEFAQHSLSKSAWAKAYYKMQRERGKKHHAAVRALAFKWIRIHFRCWKDRVPYDELAYCGQLLQRGSPLKDHLATSA